MIAPEDEAPHPIGPSSCWQESYYFNWADPAGREFGIVRLGHRPNEGRLDALVLTLSGGRPEFLYPGIGLRAGRERMAPGCLRGGRLTLTMLEPLARWRLELAGEDALALTFEAFTPAYDYGDHGGALPEHLADGHFEQAGRVTGWLRVGGRERRVEGTGERDKSWGARDWSQLAGWTWISGQCGTSLAFNLWQGAADGRDTLNGYLFDSGLLLPLVAADVAFEAGPRPHRARAARLSLTVAGGQRYDVRAEALGTFPLLRGRVWIEETHVRLSCTPPSGGVRHGVGVLEHAWRASLTELLQRSGDLAGVARDLLGVRWRRGRGP